MLKTGFTLLICFLAVTPSLFAQKRLEAGVFLDYLDVSQSSTNNFGLGARFGYSVHRAFMLEGELAYDYGINFGETYRNIVSGNIAAIENTSLGVTHGLFGSKIQPSGGGFRPFITLKGGFVDFRLSPGLLPLSNAVSTLLGLRTSSWNAAIYPAAGVEAAIGPIGLRFEVGDDLYSTMAHTIICGSRLGRSFDSESESVLCITQVTKPFSYLSQKHSCPTI